MVIADPEGMLQAVCGNGDVGTSGNLDEDLFLHKSPGLKRRAGREYFVMGGTKPSTNTARISAKALT